MKKVYPKEELTGPRISLRKHDRRLASTMFEYVEKDRARLRQFLPWVDLTRTVADENDYIEMTLEAWKNHSLFDYGLFLRNGDVYMGNCGIHTISWVNDKCEIGYWLLGEFEGQGYMSEALGLIEQELFELGFNRIEIRCNSKNERSAAVPRRNGYRLETIIRRDGALEECRDTLVFAKIRDLPFEDAADILMSPDAEHVTLFTSDLAASREFYSRAFGLIPALDLPEICEFKIGSQSLVLQTPDSLSPAGTETQMAYWPVPSLDDAIARFRELGGEICRGPLDLGNGERICQIRDPFGNTVGLKGR